MAIANPRNLDEDHIMLEDTYFKLKSPVIRVNMSSQFPGKVVIGDYGLNDNPIISTYNVVDLRGGMGMWRYPSTAGVISDTDRYWTAQNFNPMFSNGMTLGPKVTTIGSVTADTSKYNVLFIDTRKETSSGYICFIGGTTLHYKATTAAGAFSTVANILAGSKPIGDVVVHKGRLVVPTDHSTNMLYQDSGIAATNVWSALTTSGVGAVSYVSWDDQIYWIDRTGLIKKASTLPTGPPVSVGTINNTSSDYISYKLLVFDDTNNDSTIWCITDEGAWIYDASVAKFIPSKIKLMPRKSRYWANTATEGQDAPDTAVGDKLYIVRNSLNMISVTTSNGGILLEDISADKFGAPSNMLTEIYAIDAWERDEFFAITGQSSVGNNTNVLYYSGRGWHQFFTGTATVSHSLITGIVNTGSVRQAVCMFYDNGSIKYFVLDDLRENPLFSTTRTYATSGNVELPIFDAGYEAQNKIALKLRIKLSHASATETVQVSYRTNVSTSGDSYTNLGSAITANTEQILYFGTNSQGLEFKNIQLKLTLASAGSTSAPIIEYISMDFMRLPEVLRGFTVTLDTGSEGSFTDSELNEKIWSLVNTNNLLSFTYHDNTGTERSYLVKPLSPDGIEYAGNREGGAYTLYLVELNNP